MTRETLEYITELTAAFDRRDPDPNKDHGIHGVDLRMTVKGQHGAVQFILYTGWMLPNVQDEMDCRNPPYRQGPLPAEVSYHTRTPQYDGQSGTPDCDYLNGDTCYSDGSGLRAIEVFKLLLSGGSDAVWSYLEDDYFDRFTK